MQAGRFLGFIWDLGTDSYDLRACLNPGRKIVGKADLRREAGKGHTRNKLGKSRRKRAIEGGVRGHNRPHPPSYESKGIFRDRRIVRCHRAGCWSSSELGLCRTRAKAQFFSAAAPG